MKVYKEDLMERFLFYKLTYDTGFAPNPYGEYLTLAACTPNHIRANLKIGDWIVGVESEKLANERIFAGLHPNLKRSLIFIARVDEILDLNSYFHDPRFTYKRPKPKSRNYFERRGDNVYYKVNEKWEWIRGHDHDNEAAVFFEERNLEKIWKDKNARKIYGPILQDIRGNRVFISKYFLYFGDLGIEFKKDFLDCIPKGRGIKYCPGTNCPHECFVKFKSYLDSLFKEFVYGKHGDPICYSIRYKLGKKEFCK